MKKKIRLALIFGGKSEEHEVSLMSARNIYQALDKKRYDITLIGIGKSGRWLPITEQVLINYSYDTKATLDSYQKKSTVTLSPAMSQLSVSQGITAIDVVFPVLHGPYGEDGAVQGLLKLMDVPFVGAGVLGSAVGMDKDVMKRLLRDAGLPIGRFEVVKSHQAMPSFAQMKKCLGLPLFIKPANLGSSVGVSRVTKQLEYQLALKKAFQYDTKVLIEEYIEGREIECAVLGNDTPQASLPGEVITNTTHHTFYSYEAKYLDESGAAIAIPAKLSQKQIKEVRQLAVRVFQALCCEGMGRVDFFLKADGSFVVNEINTIPGFTNISMYPKLWEISGIDYKTLLDTLIQLALERARRAQ